MATQQMGGEIVHEYKQFHIDDSDITFSDTEKNGSAQAGVKLAVTMVTTADNEEQIRLAGDGDSVVGRLESVSKSKLASVAVRGSRIKFKGGTSATLTRGVGIVGDLLASARGYVRSPVTTSNVAGIEESQKARGVLIDDDPTDPILMFSY